MARCTLDDLVPSMRCNRVFLEPITSVSDGVTQNLISQYTVTFDMSIYDTVDDEDGIADYLLSENFQRHLEYKRIYCRDNSFKELNDFMKSQYNARTGTGIHPSIQAAILDTVAHHETMAAVKMGEMTVEQALESRLSEVEIPGFSDFFINTNFRNNFLSRLQAFYNSLSDIGFFAHAEASSHEGYGTRTINEDGQIEYDLKIPMGSSQFINDSTVTDCGLYVIPYYNLAEALADLGEEGFISAMTENLSLDVVQFFFKEVHECLVLRDKKPASSVVQDFRLTERIAEIMDIDRITDYDATIDMISSAAGGIKRREVNVTTPLYSSYIGSPKNLTTANTFFFDKAKFLTNNSRHSFLYRNIYYPRPGSSLNSLATAAGIIITLRGMVHELFKFDSKIIRRHRVDSKESSVIVARDGAITNTCSVRNKEGYSFLDYGFSNIEDGEYVYEFQIELHDPMENLVESLVLDTKKVLAKLDGALTYLNNANVSNNSTLQPSYDELRDEISTAAIQEILAQISPLSTTSEEFNKFKHLFALFTGEMFEYISLALSDIEDVFRSRKKMVNLRRVINDLLSEVSKYYETKDVNSSSLTSLKPSSKITFSKKWNRTVKPKSTNNMMLDIIGKTSFTMSKELYSERIREEASRHYEQIAADMYATGRHLGAFTPRQLDNISVYESETANDVIAKIAIDMLDMPIVNQSHMKMVSDFLGGYKEDYTEEEMKNNYGAFEGMLATLGVTVANRTVESFELFSPLAPAENPTSFGIEDGSNVDGTLEVGGAGTYEPVEIPSDEAELSTQDSLNADISEGYYNEFLKKEDLVSRFMTRKTGYDTFNRIDFTQGTSNRSKPSDGLLLALFNEERQQRYFPVQLRGERGNEILLKAKLEQVNIVHKCLNRLILDNTFMVFYMYDINENMQPEWRVLNNFVPVQTLINQRGKVLCKLKRFKSSKVNIGQGALSDREIFLEHFYLRN